ncbi:MAG TPA: mannose-6-phosphate isomerase [Bacteroidales bacterium]|nr:MAG: mannose-6-phosphate isomerase [Bacteroidetes bacterium GWF2_33_38]HBF89159.1 mannose-6-phosphate isomerase [Bacteroidales bacterium]
MLYPLKFNPIYKEKVWGGQKLKNVLSKKNVISEKCGESWEISGVEGDISVVANGSLKGNNMEELIEVYMGDLVGDSVYEKFGLEFPLLIKFIDADDDLSVQVHPDDETAMELHNSFGKNEMWYVVQAEKDAELINGFSKSISREEFIAHLDNGTLKDVLNVEKVKAGEVFNIPTGRVHSIGKGILLAEIQQTSDITYRIFDWNRKDLNGNYRELHTDFAISVLNFELQSDYKLNYSSELNQTNAILANKYFTVNYLEIDKQLEKDYVTIDSFVIFMCIDGNFEIITDGNEIININKGETVLIPAEIKLVNINPKTKSTFLEVYIEIPQTDVD